MVAQKHTHTAANRYPGIFRTVRAWLDKNKQTNSQPLRILSFGCSSGEEMLTLRAYFPEATIVGCDTNIEMLRRSQRILRGDQGITFFSSPENIDAFGPYDAIFAMSVLCQFPTSRTVTNLSELFPFQLFERLALNLANNIKPGGVFCLFNSNYLFNELSCSNEFTTLRSEQIHTTGFIDRFSADGSRLTNSVGHRDAFYQKAEPNVDLTDDDLIDCLHIRKTKSTTKPQVMELSKITKPKGYISTVAVAISGFPHSEAQEKKGISSQLFASKGEDAAGNNWQCYQWKKQSLDGKLLEFPTWYQPYDPLNQGILTNDQQLSVEDTLLKTKKPKSILGRIQAKIQQL